MSFPRSAFTGFPFDDSDFGERDRDRSFRSHIDDIVNRHPELADHLSFDNSFPFGSSTWGHKQRGSSERDSASSTTERPEHRRFGRPLRSRFEERFGFPFANSFDDPYYYQKQDLKPETPQVSEPAPKAQDTQSQTEEKPPQAPPKERQNRKQNTNIQQSNTVDLGQKQEPVTDSRSQRSMSAPPENRSGPQQRFVSSINIPMFGQSDSEAQQQQQPQAQPQPQKGGAQAKTTTERVIPIHVEGRDVPVVPRHDNAASFTPPPQQQPPQAPRGFGQRPFGSWNRPNPPYYTGDPNFYPEDGQSFSKGPFAAQKPQPPQQQKPQNVHHPQQQQQRSTPSPQPQQPPTEPQQPTPPPQPTQKLGPMDQIKCIQKDVLHLMSQVERFNGKPRDKQYLYLDEMLTRNLLKLDDVETEGRDDIRQARKESINCIQRCISILEAKAAANEQLRNQLMQIDKGMEPNSGASLEVSGVSRSGSQTKSNEEESTPMDVDSDKKETPKEANAETNTQEATNEKEPKNSGAEEAKTNEDDTNEVADSKAVKKKDGQSESG